MREAVLDANILLRYLTDEPRDLADRVAAILEAADRERISLLLAPITLAEVVYVLESVYHWQRGQIAERLLDLISAPVLVVLEQERWVRALHWYRDIQGLDLADAFVAAVAADRGHGQVVSFDKHMQRLPGITLVQDPAQVRRD